MDEDEEIVYEYDGEPLNVPADDLKEMMQFVNVDGLDQSLIQVASSHRR